MAEHASSANGPYMIDRVQRPMFLARLSLAAPYVLPKVAVRARPAERRPDGWIGTLRRASCAGGGIVATRDRRLHTMVCFGLRALSLRRTMKGPAMAGPSSHALFPASAGRRWRRRSCAGRSRPAAYRATFTLGHPPVLA